MGKSKQKSDKYNTEDYSKQEKTKYRKETKNTTESLKENMFNKPWIVVAKYSSFEEADSHKVALQLTERNLDIKIHRCSSGFKVKTRKAS